jgi:regulatory protein
MLITDIVSLDNKKRKVYIDGKYTFPLYLGEIRQFNIAIGEGKNERKLVW